MRNVDGTKCRKLCAFLAAYTQECRYVAGGQVWKFTKGQKEVTSGSNAAMGLSIPLAIGAAVAEPKSQILAVTGDGSLELNIQELKTISHNEFNIK